MKKQFTKNFMGTRFPGYSTFPNLCFHSVFFTLLFLIELVPNVCLSFFDSRSLSKPTSADLTHFVLYFRLYHIPANSSLQICVISSTSSPMYKSVLFNILILSQFKNIVSEAILNLIMCINPLQLLFDIKIQSMPLA